MVKPGGLKYQVETVGSQKSFFFVSFKKIIERRKIEKFFLVQQDTGTDQKHEVVG